MKYIFIVNPAAGRGKVPAIVREAVAGREHCSIYETRAPRDATEYIRSFCAAAEKPEELCFVACGGDGTLNEVASGVAETQASMSVYALGSGNDFVKIFGGLEVFRDVEAILNAEPIPVDLLRVNDRWAVNAFHFGFDSSVAKTMGKVKTLPIIGGRNAYPAGVVKALLFDMKTRCSMRVDGEDFHDGDMLLCTVANGQYVGGSYRCAPRSRCDDGLAEVCLVRPVSRLKFVSLMDEYRDGSHLTDPRFERYITYRQGKSVEVDGGEGFSISVDGEVVEGTHFRVEVVPGALRFAAAGAQIPIKV